MNALFDLIAFDADDTLWHNERLFLLGRQRLEEILAPYQITENIQEHLEAIEVANLKYYGYGVMSFILSSIEAAVSLTAGRMASNDVKAVLDLGKSMLSANVELFEGVEDMLVNVQPFSPLMLITKGEPNHQYSKLERSGIRSYFQFIEVVHDKSQDVYAEILARVKVAPDRFLMIGNSIRSDILPVLALGGWAVHLPNNLTWSHEIIDLSEIPQGKFFKLSNIKLLPELLNQLTQKEFRKR
jgi:putative hydrolase of the HAD superfamily